MRLSRSLLAPLTAFSMLTACSLEDITGGGGRYDPTDLTYRLIPSGEPEMPLGVLLEWTPPSSSRVAAFDVLARSSAGGEWVLRATTTSASFHDAGLPQLQYLVVATDEDGNELGRSASITIDERNRLPAPAELRSTPLDRAVQLTWSRNAYDASPAQFDVYRVYSAPYDAAASRCRPGGWALEGTTISHAFLATGLENGVARCFAVSAVSRDGHESTWSPVRLETPRADAPGVLLGAFESQPATSGFVVVDPAGGPGGAADGRRRDLDVRVERGPDGSLRFRLVRPGARVAVDGVLRDGTSAAAAGARGVAAVPGWLYLFAVPRADGMHQAAVRVSYAADDRVVLEWASQSAVGNPDPRSVGAD